MANIDYNWNRYMEKMAPAIAALKVRFAQKTGHTPTDQECWAYLAWCSDIFTQHVFMQVPPEDTTMIMELFKWVSDNCSNNYRASITGRYDPPSTVRYESPAAFEAAKKDMAQRLGYSFGENNQPEPPPTSGGQVIEDHHRGYL